MINKLNPLLSNVKVSIGLPVYNREKSIEECIRSILDQTFQNFELIISDNASTDNTEEICKKYAREDKRITYFRQKENMGAFWNYDFVVKQAKNEYFVWISSDEIFLPRFLEANLNVLISNKNAVGCMSGLEFSDKQNKKFMRINKFLHKKGISFRPYELFPITGTYEKRISLFLKKMPWHLFYGVFLTSVVKKSSIPEPFVGNDGVCILKILRHGEIHIVNEILKSASASGTQSKGHIHMAKQFNKGFFSTIFPYYPFTIYCKKEIGIKLFIKNIGHIIRINFDGEFLLLVDLLEWIKYKIADNNFQRTT